MTIVLPTAYLPPIYYFSLLTRAESIIMERFEHYPKQTYRNRCIIYGANGPLTLTVPVTKGSELKVYTKDIRIDNSANWRKIHLKALESAYQNSPFYQYYIDEFIPVLTENHCYLYDLNSKLIECISSLIGINPAINETNVYVHEYSSEISDCREAIHPKERMWTPNNLPKYHQVFETKHGFQPNLSIVDLLFNTGPESLTLLGMC